MSRPLRYQRPSRTEWLLQQLQSGPLHSAYAARTLNCPDASVRRDIGKLRAEGHYITFDASQGVYRLYTRPLYEALTSYEPLP